MARRRELVDELAPYRDDALEGHPWASWAAAEQERAEGKRMPGATSRWNAGKDLSWEPLRAELVVEVAYDHLQGTRFRHATHFRPLAPGSRPARPAPTHSSRSSCPRSCRPCSARDAAPGPTLVSLGGIVLAGGAGRRFGRPKAGVVLEGRTLVERAVDTLRPHCPALLVVSRPEVELPALDRDASVTTGPGPMPRSTRWRPVSPPSPRTTCSCWRATSRTRSRSSTVWPSSRRAPRRWRATAPAEGGSPCRARYPRLAALEVCERLLASGDLRLLPLVDALAASAIDATDEELANVNSPDDLAARDRAHAPAGAGRVLKARCQSGRLSPSMLSSHT